MKENHLRNLIVTIVILTLLIFYKPAFSEKSKDGIEVKLTSAQMVETLPGKTISGNYLVINHTEREEEFLEEIKLPEGWFLLIEEDASFSIGPYEKEIRVFGISVPPNSPPETNEVTISVRNKREPSLKDEKPLIVKVLPFYALSLGIEEKPDKVVSGLTFTIRARVFNQGNLKVKVNLTPTIHPESPIRIEPSNILEIEAGSSRLFSIIVKTDEKINKKVNQIISIKASVEGIEERISSETSLAIQIIPRMVGKEDPYHRIPSTLTLKGFYQSNHSEDRLRGQIEFIGSGPIDEKGEKLITFKFRGPENRSGIYFNKEEYMLAFSTKGFNLHLGDGIYSLSSLLGPSTTNRGIKAGYSYNRFAIKGFFSQPKVEHEKIQNSFGGSILYKFVETGDIRLNFLRNNLHGDKENYLLSLSSEAHLKRILKMAIEGGLSWEEDKEGYALKVSLSGEPIKKFKFFIINYYIEPNFSGSITPGEYFSGGISFPIWDWISGDINLSKLRENYHQNREDKNRKENSLNDEFSFMGGLSMKLPREWNLGFYYRFFDRKDRVEPINYNYQDNLLRLNLQKSLTYKTIGTFFNAYIEGGRTRDKLNSEEKNAIYFGLSGNLKFIRGQNYTFFITHGRDYYEEKNQKVLNIGVTGTWKLFKNFVLYLGYFSNLRDFEKDRYLRQNLRSKVSYLLPNKHSINLEGNWIDLRNGNNNEASINLSYTIPFGIPVEKKKSVGTIKGVIFDEEDPRRHPIKDVILMASGIPAVTDKEGKFVLPGLKPGQYFLQVERDSIGHGKTTSEKIEPVEVKGGETSRVDIGILRSGKITGKVEVFTPKKSLIIGETTPPEDYIPSGGLPEVLIEISRKNEVLRQFTDSSGEFIFDEIRPGIWKVKVYEESLPALHVLKEKEFEVEIKPSEEKTIKVEVLKKPRRVLLIDEEK